MAEQQKNNNNHDDKRFIFLTGMIDEQKAEKIATKLFGLEFKDPVSPIILIIDSPGGMVDSMWTIINVMDLLRCPLQLYLQGQSG